MMKTILALAAWMLLSTILILTLVKCSPKTKYSKAKTMSANLNEFTTEQLQVLLNVVVSKIIDEDLHRKEWLKVFNSSYNESLGNEFFYDWQPGKAKEYETLQLFRVQILNSIVEVKLREEVASN